MKPTFYGITGAMVPGADRNESLPRLDRDLNKENGVALIEAPTEIINECTVYVNIPLDHLRKLITRSERITRGLEDLLLKRQREEIYFPPIAALYKKPPPTRLRNPKTAKKKPVLKRASPVKSKARRR